MDLFEKKQISPMLIGEKGPAFDNPEYIFELKWDGTRCLAYLNPDTGVHLENKRFKILTPYFPEMHQLHRQVKARCILDGELFVLNEGKVDFFEMQRRSLMTNAFKIQLVAAKLPVSFVAFDILHLDGEQLTTRPLMERKQRLSETVTENDRIAVAHYLDGLGTELYRLAADQGLEGIVAKRKDSLYSIGKRTKVWVKCKNLMDDDFVVCGYYFKADNLVSVILGSYAGDQLEYQGHVVMGMTRHDYQHLQAAAATVKEEYFAGFPDFDGARWLTPLLVCKVEYMERTPGGGLRQPVFRGLRDDKMPESCRRNG